MMILRQYIMSITALNKAKIICKSGFRIKYISCHCESLWADYSVNQLLARHKSGTGVKNNVDIAAARNESRPIKNTVVLDKEKKKKKKIEQNESQRHSAAENCEAHIYTQQLLKNILFSSNDSSRISNIAATTKQQSEYIKQKRTEFVSEKSRTHTDLQSDYHGNEKIDLKDIEKGTKQVKQTHHMMARQAVPQYVMLRFRSDVLSSSEYRGRTVMSRKAWLEAAPSVAGLMKKLKSAHSSAEVESMVSVLSTEDIVQLVQELVNGAISPITPHLSSRSSLRPTLDEDRRGATLRYITEALVNECCCRIHMLGGGALFLLADGLQQMTNELTGGVQLWQRYVLGLFKTFEYRWKELVRDRRDILQLSYLIASLRYAPLHLLHQLESHVCDHIDLFNMCETALICHAFFTANTSLREYRTLDGIGRVVVRELDRLMEGKAMGGVINNGRRLSERTNKTLSEQINDERELSENGSKFDNRFGNCSSNRSTTPSDSAKSFKLSSVKGSDELNVKHSVTDDRSSLRFYQLSCILKALRHAQYDRLSFYQHLADSLVLLKVKLSSAWLSDLANILFTFASRRIIHTDLLQVVSSCVTDERFVGPLAAPRLKDLGRMIWAMAELGCEVPQGLIDKLLEVMRSNPGQLIKYPEVTVEALVGLSMVGAHPQDLIALVLSERFTQLKSSRPLEQDYQMSLLKTVCAVYSNDHSSLSSSVASSLQKETDVKVQYITHDNVKSLADGCLPKSYLKNSQYGNNITDSGLKKTEAGSLARPSQIAGLIERIYSNTSKCSDTFNQIPESTNTKPSMSKPLISLYMEDTNITKRHSSTNRVQISEHTSSNFVVSKPQNSLSLDNTDFINQLRSSSNRLRKLVQDSVSVDRLGDLDHELKTRQGLSSLITTLDELLGDTSKVQAGFILPYSRIADVLLKINLSSREPVAISDDELPWKRSTLLWNSGDDVRDSRKHRAVNRQYTVIEGSDIQTKTDAVCNECLVLKVLGQNQYARNAPLLLGLPALELRVLTRLGFEIFVVEPGVASQLDQMSDAERLNFVRQFLLNKCGIKL